MELKKFSYTVTNKENKLLSGTINAADLEHAKNELLSLGFKIETIEKLEETENLDLRNKFKFQATDSSGKKISGNIRANSRIEAYKKLINEYKFNVEYLIDLSLSEKEQEKQALLGTHDLEDQIKEEEFAEKNKLTSSSLDFNFLNEQSKLKLQVDFVLQKVNKLIDEHKNDLNPTSKEKIKYFVEKILRIKNSTNLDYIRETCKNLLTFLQQEELFLLESEKKNIKTQVIMEAKSMMLKLKNYKKNKSLDLFNQIISWQKRHIINNPNPNLIEKFLNFFTNFLTSEINKYPELQKIKIRLTEINVQIKDYIILYFQSKDPEFKKETKLSIKKLLYERKQLKQQFNRSKKELKINQAIPSEYKPTIIEKIVQELYKISGFTLIFYITYYFLALYSNTKQSSFFSPQPGIEIIFQTYILKYLFIAILLIHISTGIKIIFFENKKSSHLIFPTTFLIFIFILLNF